MASVVTPVDALVILSPVMPSPEAVPCCNAEEFFPFRSALKDKVKGYQPELDCCPLVSLPVSSPCLAFPGRPHERN